MNRKTRTILTRALVVIAVLVALYLTRNNGGPDDEELEEQQYCQMVRDGYWPDFRKNAAEVCGDAQAGARANAHGNARY